jgi:dienelactone hydrolase
MPLAKWHAYRDYAASAGFPVPATEIVYPNASHGWTNPDFSAPRYNPQARSARACPTLMIMPGARGFLIDGKLQADDPALLQSCRESSRGYTMAYDESIRARSTSDALAFLGRALHAN